MAGKVPQDLDKLLAIVKRAVAGVDVTGNVSAAISAHTIIEDAHHNWPLQDTDIPSSIARDTELVTAISVHTAIANAHHEPVTIGNGLELSGQQVALATPGSLSVTTLNAAEGNHTHDINTSSNPGQTAVILATDSSGNLSLYGMDVTNLLDTKDLVISGDVTADGGEYSFTSSDGVSLYMGDIFGVNAPAIELSSETHLSLSALSGINTVGSIGSNNFSSGSTGWQINATGQAEFAGLASRNSLFVVSGEIQLAGDAFYFEGVDGTHATFEDTILFKVDGQAEIEMGSTIRIRGAGVEIAQTLAVNGESQFNDNINLNGEFAGEGGSFEYYSEDGGELIVADVVELSTANSQISLGSDIYLGGDRVFVGTELRSQSYTMTEEGWQIASNGNSELGTLLARGDTEILGGLQVGDDVYFETNLEVNGITSTTNLNVGFVQSHLIPGVTDTYDLGNATKLWRKGWLSELESILFVEQSISAIGGWFLIPHGQGTLVADVDATTTTIDFGLAMSVNDFVIMRGNLSVEYLKIGTLVSGTTYNVTRNVDGTGANSWPAGQVFIVLGNSNDGRIELDAQTGGPRISVLEQGETYNSQTERVRIGDMSGWGSYTGYGIGLGDPNGDHLAYSPTTGLVLTNYATIAKVGTDIETAVADLQTYIEGQYDGTRQQVIDWGHDNDATLIDGGNIYTGSIYASMIAANTITADEIAANAITASELAANSVTANHIVSGTITAGQIAAGTITVNQLNFTPTDSTNVVGIINASDEGLAINAARVDFSGVVSVGGAAADVNAGTTTIDGGHITANTITVNQLNFTPTDSTNIVGIINTSNEGIVITASRIDLSGVVTIGGAAADVNAGTTTIDGGSITANTITAAHINVTTLQAVAINTGNLTISGVLGIGTGGGIYQGTGTFASPTTGLKIWNNAGVGRLATYDSGAFQVGFNSSGQLEAGAGAVTLDSDGIIIQSGISDTTTVSPQSIDFVNGSALVTQLHSYSSSSVVISKLKSIATTIGDSIFFIESNSKSNADASLILTASSSAGDYSQIVLSADYLITKATVTADITQIGNELRVVGELNYRSDLTKNTAGSTYTGYITVPVITTTKFWNGVNRTGGTVYTISCATMGIPSTAKGVYLGWHIYSANQNSSYGIGYNAINPDDCSGIISYWPNSWSISSKGQGRCNVNNGNIYFRASHTAASVQIWVTAYDI